MPDRSSQATDRALRDLIDACEDYLDEDFPTDLTPNLNHWTTRERLRWTIDEARHAVQATCPDEEGRLDV